MLQYHDLRARYEPDDGKIYFARPGSHIPHTILHPGPSWWPRWVLDLIQRRLEQGLDKW